MYILGKRDAGLYLEQASLKAYLNEGDKWTIETDECSSNCIVATLKKEKKKNQCISPEPQAALHLISVHCY